MNVIDDDLAALPPHGWLVVACKGGLEKRAKDELTKQKYRAWMAWEVSQRMNRGTAVLRREPFIPGYVFVAKPGDMSLEEMNLGKIRHTPGVIDIIPEACGGLSGQWRPAMIGHPMVLVIQHRCDVRAAEIQRQFIASNEPKCFDVGDDLTVVDGPFVGKAGSVDELFVVSPNERITLLLDMLGARVPISILAAHVAKTEAIMGGGSVTRSPQTHPPISTRS